MALFINPEQLENYLLDHSSEEDPVLKELSRQTFLNETHPQMLSGHILGSFLRLFSQLVSPGRILEIGTFTGYSAICLASGLKPGGILTSIEMDEEVCNRAVQFIERAGFSGRIRVINGDALDVIPSLDEVYELVFMDAHKDHYTEYYRMIIDRVAPGGYIVADNVLWGGKVIADPDADATTRSVGNFNRMVTEDRRVENLLLPIRDGIMVIKKR